MRGRMSNSLYKNRENRFDRLLSKKKKKREKEALMEVLELSVTKQMLDRKAICSRKHCGNFLP